jgi:hypothetical protein
MCEENVTGGRQDSAMTNRLSISAIEAVAGQQHGVFSERQARACGVSAHMLWHHTRRGQRWSLTAARVYEVADRPGDWRRPLMAAALSLGDGGRVSHRSAGQLLRVDGVRDGPPEVIVARGRTNPEWRLHRQANVPAEITVTDVIPHTTPARTLRDLCSVLDENHLEMALESALRLGYMTLDDFERLAATAGWKGVTRLRAVLDRRPPGAPPTGSELETRFVQLVRVLGLPDPERQYAVMLNGDVIAVLDLCWPDVGLFVELDGGTHEQLAALRRDRQRQNDVVRLLGWRPLRFTWTDVVQRPNVTGRIVRQAHLPRASAF